MYFYIYQMIFLLIIYQVKNISAEIRRNLIYIENSLFIRNLIQILNIKYMTTRNISGEFEKKGNLQI